MIIGQIDHLPTVLRIVARHFGGAARFALVEHLSKQAADDSIEIGAGQSGLFHECHVSP